jgi:glyoxylase-like metal-dependent hydrolase (beta-lactamase superfamily II)
MNSAAKFRRRLFAVLAALLSMVCGSAAAQMLPPGITQSETEQLAENLYAFRWGPYRSIFLVTDEGVIATDPISTEGAKHYRAAIATITDQPVKFVVYSHAHWDHAAGGGIFKDEGAQFVAQERCITNMAESPNPAIVPPDITFKDNYSVTLGNTASICITSARATAPASS